MIRKDFINGLKDGVPIALGYFSVSMAFGLSAVMMGIPVWSAVLISATNLTSAGQAAAIKIMEHQGSLFELALTTLIINIRYFLMSLSLSQKEGNMSISERLAASFGITDEVFAVSIKRKNPLTAAYMSGLILLPFIGWVGGTALGSIATTAMPSGLSAAMGIALYAMFIAIIIPPARESKNIMGTVIMAVVMGLALSYIPFLKGVSSGWRTIIITLIVSSISATFMPLGENTDE